jgi:Rod binding domain-containing protein
MASFSEVGLTATNVAMPHAAQPRLVKAAHEFEAQLMKELLRPLAASSGLPGDGGDGEGETGTLGEFAAESLAGALSAHGGLGIASRIIGDISRTGNISRNSPVTERPTIDTVMNPRK